MAAEKIKQKFGYYVRRFFRYLILTITFTVFVTLGCNIYINNYSDEYLYDAINDIPETEYALLLGTSKYVIGGDNNKYFDNRIQAAVELFNAEKIKAIIVSGDNREKNYDEPSVMKNELIQQGVPDSSIIIESTGFRTYNSIIAYKKTFGTNSIVIISQKFHNTRAVFIAKKLGVNAIGYNAKDIGFMRGYKTRIREYFAKVKAVIDVNFDD